MRNGILATPLPGGLDYGPPIGKAAQDNNFSPPLLYAIGWIETISVVGWIAAMWPGKTPATVVTGDGTEDDPYGYGIFQETPATSGFTLPENWDDPYAAASFAVQKHLAEAETYWASYASGGDLVRCIAAEYNAGRAGAQQGHDEGDVGKFTTPSQGVSYSDRVLAAYNVLVAGKLP